MALSIAYPPKDATTSPAIDIVAVHGLGGDAFNTWTHPKSKAFWLEDFLPQQIPDARIMTFGYNAAGAFVQSTAEIIDHAKSLLASLVDKREESEVQQFGGGQSEDQIQNREVNLYRVHLTSVGHIEEEEGFVDGGDAGFSLLGSNASSFR